MKMGSNTNIKVGKLLKILKVSDKEKVKNRKNQSKHTTSTSGNVDH